MSKNSWSDLLRQKGLRSTPQRQHLLETLNRQKRPLSAEEIHQSIRSSGCDLATVYRNLQQLEELGLVEKTYLSDQVARYQLHPPGRSHHTHHIECRSCHRVTPVSQCLLADQVKLLESLGFRNVTHRLEFEAVCPACA